MTQYFGSISLLISKWFLHGEGTSIYNQENPIGVSQRGEQNSNVL